MTRLIWVVLISLPLITFYFLKCYYVEMRPHLFSESMRYKMARHMIAIMKFNGFIHTKVYGKENLPEKDGYVMYANHQGKYDVLGIISVHDLPCTYVIDEKRSHLIFAKQFTRLLNAICIDKTSIRRQVAAVLEIVKNVKEGRRVIVFPEGGYNRNHNNLNRFLPGAFKAASKAKCPIVPVAIIDSYKVFEYNSLLPVRTQVHFLEPIEYEEYKDMTSHEISELVKSKIQETIKAHS